MMKPILTNTLLILLAIALSISACTAAPPAVPTIDAAIIQNTAVAAAMTIVAQTQAAIPTATTIPFTDTPTQTQTPLPTDTPLVVATETLAVQVQATATAIPASGNTDPCNAPLKAHPLGQLTKIKLENNSGAPITASIYLNKTPFGECGFRGYNISKSGAVTITDLPQACYNVSVFVNDPKKPSRAFGYGCINNPDQWTFVINKNSVALVGR